MGHSLKDQGQSTVEFALVLPIVVLCFGLLAGLLSACLSTLRLNDFVRLVARSAATSSDTTGIQSEFEKKCQCNLRISVDSDIVLVHASRPFTFPVIGSSLAPLQLQAESFAMKEPTVIFQEPAVS